MEYAAKIFKIDKNTLERNIKDKLFSVTKNEYKILQDNISQHFLENPTT